MKRYNFIFQGLYLILTMILVNCSENIDISPSISDLSEGYFYLTVNTPELEVVKTKSIEDEENLISSSCKHYILLYGDKEGQPDKLIYREERDILSPGEKYKIEVPKSTNAYSHIIVVANIPATEDAILNLATGENGSEYSELLEIMSPESNDQPSSPFVMAGKAIKESDGSYKTDLLRNVAKVSIDLNENIELFTLEGYKMYNAPKQGLYVGSLKKENYLNGDNTFEAFSGERSLYTYSYPVKSAGNGDEGSYFIIKGKFSGEECYYRVDLLKENKDKKDNPEYYDLEPNHWYQVTIKEVRSKGYDSEVEAAQHFLGEDNTLDIEIHDHSVNVLSMVSDGTKELGVTDNITFNGNTTNFVIRLYDYNAEDSSYPTLSPITGKQTKHSGTDYIVEVKDSWFKLTKFEDVSTSIDESQDSEGEVIKESSGKKYRYTVTVDESNSMGGSQTGTIIVKWRGLEREVKVNFKGDFKPSAVVKQINFIMHDTDDNVDWVEDNDRYFNFLRGEAVSIIGNKTQRKSIKLFGIDETAMGIEKVRNEGFHFPIMYGNNPQNPWWYEYQVSLFDGELLKSYRFFEIKLNVTNGPASIWSEDKFIISATTSFFNVNFTETKIERGKRQEMIHPIGVSMPLVLKRAIVGENLKGIGGVTNDYDYGTAELIITLYQNIDDTEGLEYSLNLYHTGFFHYDEKEDENKYLYYEVVPCGSIHWLDRNIGARSCQMYVDNGSETLSVGNKEAVGYYYTIATIGTWNSAIDSDPKLDDSKICPPGYHIPNVTEWDDLRLSTNFTSSQLTESGKSYVANYYVSKDGAGKIYFPKGRYYNYGSTANKTIGDIMVPVWDSNKISGDNGSGYYWTRTPSSGLEKQQIGQWLKVLNISGASNTYVNGNVQFDRMNVRCVAGKEAAPENSYSINFNVKGATHVYLYTIDDKGNKNGVFTFPGKAIGNQKTVDGLGYSKPEDYNSDNGYLHFSYTSSVPADDLFVLFTYVTDDNKITIISQNEASTLKDALGYNVRVGYNYYFYWENNMQNINYSKTHIFKRTSESGSGDSESETPEPLSSFSKGDILRIYWEKTRDGYDLNRIHLYYTNNGGEITTFPGYYKKGEAAGDRYYYDLTLPRNCDAIVAIVNCGSSVKESLPKVINTSDVTISTAAGVDFEYNKGYWW